MILRKIHNWLTEGVRDSQKKWLHKTLCLQGSNIQWNLAHMLSSELLNYHFEVIWASLFIPDQVQLICNSHTKESETSGILQSRTRILPDMDFGHGFSTITTGFRLASVKWNNKVFKKKRLYFRALLNIFLIYHFEIIWACPFRPDFTSNQLHVKTHFWDIGLSGILQSDWLRGARTITQELEF